MSGLHKPLNALCLQELQTTKEHAFFQLSTIFPKGHVIVDTAENGKVGSTVVLLEGQVVLDQGCKGDGYLAWVKTVTSQGELFVASIYGDRRRCKRVELWNWMEKNLPMGNWLICGDFNHTVYVEDSVGPTPLLHGLKRRAWNRLSNKFDLLDNRLVAVTKTGPHFTQ